MALIISEDWVRDRVQLKHSNLEDVRSLSLPGTYHEKISLLADSLRHFSRLKCLDLSRNAVSCLAGLENLKMLEKLNLYYNCVPRLEELYRLRHNPVLEEIDLRLNPVARNEPDYRLFLIHLLPSLRRLDDRSVSDNERRAALMHFNSDQAGDLMGVSPPVTTVTPAVHSRAQHVRSLAKPPSALDDDGPLLDLLTETRTTLPPQLTGSTASRPGAEEYPPSVVQAMDRGEIGYDDVSFKRPGKDNPQSKGVQFDDDIITYSAGDGPHIRTLCPAAGDAPPSLPCVGDNVDAEFQSRYPNLAAMSRVRPDDPETDRKNRLRGVVTGQNSAPSYSIVKRVQFSDDPNLQFVDEAEAYASYKARGFFTPNPAAVSNERHRTSDYHYELESAPSTANSQCADAEIKGCAELAGEYGDHVRRLSLLVDKYWNGANSLLKNQRFQSQIVSLLQSLPQSTDTTDSQRRLVDTATLTSDEVSEIKRLTQENERLREQLASGGGSVTEQPADDSKLRPILARAHRDVAILRTRLQRSIEENRSLQDAVAGFESRNAATATSTCDIEELERLARENAELRRDITSLHGRVHSSGQLEKLAEMLQQSHKSLVDTNEHLLREMEENRQRHLHEVKQLHWSYDQLKRSVNESPLNGGS